MQLKLKPTIKEIKAQVRSKSKLVQHLIWEMPTGERQASFKEIRWDENQNGFAALFPVSSLSPLIPGHYVLRSGEICIFELVLEGVRIVIEKTPELVIEDTLTLKIFSSKPREVDLELRDAELLTREDSLKLGVSNVAFLVTGFNPHISARLPPFSDEISLSARPRLDLHKDRVDSGEQVEAELVAPIDAEMGVRWKTAVDSGEIPLDETQVGKRSRRSRASFALGKAGTYEIEAIDRHRGVSASKTLIVRPNLAFASPVDTQYFMDQEVILRVETSEPIEEGSFRLLVVDEEHQRDVDINCLEIAGRPYFLSLNASQLGEGRHSLLLSLTKKGITSTSLDSQIDVVRGKIEVLPRDRDWFRLGEGIQLEVSANEATRLDLVNLDTSERQIIELQESDKPFVFTGKAVPKDIGKFVAQVTGLESRKFVVGPELSVRCHKLERNYWRLTDSPSQYRLIIKVSARIHPSQVRVAFSGRKKEEIALGSFRASAEKGGLTIYNLALSEVILDVDSLKAGKYFVNVSVPYNSRKLHVHIPPPLEVGRLGDLVLFVNERLTLKGGTDKGANLDFALKPVPSLALSLLPTQEVVVQSKARPDGTFQVELDLANLHPGLQYEVHVAAESGEVRTEEMAGKISLVSVSTYRSACSETEEAVVVAQVPANVKVEMDGIESPATNPLPCRVFRIAEAGVHTLSFGNREVTLSIEEEVDVPLTVARVESLFPFRLIEQRGEPDSSSPPVIVLLSNDTEARTREYLATLTEVFDADKSAALVLVPTDMVFQRQISSILGVALTRGRDSRPMIGIMPWPTPYYEPFKDLQQALAVKEKKRLTPLLRWACPACSEYGSYFIVPIGKKLVEFCEICGHQVSSGKALVEDLAVDKERWIAEVRGKEFPAYAPVLLNCELLCPQCSMPLIPAFRVESDNGLTFLICRECGLRIRTSFLLQELRMFPPKLLVASTRMIRWLIESGSKFFNVYGKLRVCSNCGRVHPLGKPLGEMTLNMLGEMLRFIETEYPQVLANMEQEYERLESGYRHAMAFKGFERRLLETGEEIRGLAEDAKRLDFADGVNLERHLQSRLKSLHVKLRSLDLGGIRRKSEVEGEIARLIDSRLSLEGEERKLGARLESLHSRAAQTRIEAVRAERLRPALNLLYFIARFFNLGWKPPHVSHEEALKELRSLESEINEIELHGKTLRKKEDDLRRQLEKDELNAETLLINGKIQELEQFRKQSRRLVSTVRRLALHIGISDAIESIEDMKQVADKVEDEVPEWRQRKEAMDKYEVIAARRAKLVSSWEADILSHMLSIAKIEDPMEQELLWRDLSDCLVGLSFVKEWKATPSGRRFLEGDDSKLNECVCGGQFESVERVLNCVVMEDFSEICVARGKDRIIEPSLEKAVEALVETGARVIISSRK